MDNFFVKNLFIKYLLSKFAPNQLHEVLLKVKFLLFFFDFNVSSIDWTIPIGIFGGNNVLAGDDDTKSQTLISASFE